MVATEAGVTIFLPVGGHVRDLVDDGLLGLRGGWKQGQPEFACRFTLVQFEICLAASARSAVCRPRPIWANH